jgi:hypothetical protein
MASMSLDVAELARGGGRLKKAVRSSISRFLTTAGDARSFAQGSQSPCGASRANHDPARRLISSRNATMTMAPSKSAMTIPRCRDARMARALGYAGGTERDAGLTDNVSTRRIVAAVGSNTFSIVSSTRSTSPHGYPDVCTNEQTESQSTHYSCRRVMLADAVGDP